MSEPEERFSGLDPAFAGKFSVYGLAFWVFVYEAVDGCSSLHLSALLYQCLGRRHLLGQCHSCRLALAFILFGFSFSVHLLLVLFFPFSQTVPPCSMLLFIDIVFSVGFLHLALLYRRPLHYAIYFCEYNFFFLRDLPDFVLSSSATACLVECRHSVNA